jgi:hypothetical protein
VRYLSIAVAATAFAAAAPTAGAKSFQPGDVRVCGARACIVLRSQPVLDVLSSFYYGARSPTAAPAPPTRTPYLRLLYANGYVTGVVAGPRFTRFLSFGVHTGYFRARVWYAVPPRVAAELRLLASKLAPAALPADILASSH